MNTTLRLITAYIFLTRVAYVGIFLSCLHWLLYFPNVTLSLTVPIAYLSVKLMDWIVGSMLLEHRDKIDAAFDDMKN